MSLVMSTPSYLEECPLILGLIHVFLMIKLRLLIFGRSDVSISERPIRRHMMSIVPLVMIIEITWFR